MRFHYRDILCRQLLAVEVGRDGTGQGYRVPGRVLDRAGKLARNQVVLPAIYRYPLYTTRSHVRWHVPGEGIMRLVIVVVCIEGFVIQCVSHCAIPVIDNGMLGLSHPDSNDRVCHFYRLKLPLLRHTVAAGCKNTLIEARR